MKFEIDINEIESIINKAVKEDIGSGDITTNNIIPAGIRISGNFIAKETGIMAGLPIVKHIFSKSDKEVCFKPLVEDGDSVERGQIIAKITGEARTILAYERMSLNFLQRLSGIATLTSIFVKKVENLGINIIDTRKTTPGWRYLEKYAVKVGGGKNHRMGLYDQVLIKDNHLSILNNATITDKNQKDKDASIIDVVQSIKAQISKDILIELEVDLVEKISEALESRADIIMFDNMNPNQIKDSLNIVDDWCCKTKEKRPIIEVSGGITLENITNIACKGIDRIAIGAITHSVKALDISLEIS